LSAQGVRTRPHEHAVVWRTGAGPTSSGRLELGDDDLILHGSGGPDGLRIAFDELSSVEIGRGAAERINGDKSLVLERPSCERVLVAALGGGGPARRARGSIRAAPRRAGGAGMRCRCCSNQAWHGRGGPAAHRGGAALRRRAPGARAAPRLRQRTRSRPLFRRRQRNGGHRRALEEPACAPSSSGLFALHDVLPGHLLLCAGSPAARIVASVRPRTRSAVWSTSRRTRGCSIAPALRMSKPGSDAEASEPGIFAELVSISSTQSAGVSDSAYFIKSNELRPTFDLFLGTRRGLHFFRREDCTSSGASRPGTR
jgi:hypothetical protein